MTNRIDRFIEAMFRKSADTLLFGTGTPVRIRTGNRERVILDKEVRTEQIVKLLSPIAGEAVSSLTEDGETRFIYDAPAGRVWVTATTRGSRMTAVFLPSGTMDESSAAGRPPVDDDVLDFSSLADSAVDLAAAAAADYGPIEIMRNGLPTEEPSDAGGGQSAGLVDGEPWSRPPEPVPERRPPEPVPERRPPRREDDEAPVPSVATRAPAVSASACRPTPGPSAPERPKRASGAEPKINAVLRDLVSAGGSDLHLTSGQRPRIRVDGDIEPLDGWSDVLSSAQIDEWMADVAHEQAHATFVECNDADFAHEIDGVARFRMNWFRDRNGVGAVMRTIPSKVLTADQLKLPRAVRELCELPKGLVVVTGPTGSGKSTTLAAMIDLINKTRADHIITIEDPVEFVHDSIKCLVNQREVHSHTKSFSAALRAALREDPDIVLVGELRDLETVHIAIETAETGHLVFGTLHTNTAASTVDRMIDQFPTDRQAQIRVMLSESLRGVIAQTLCKKKGGGRVACMEILIGNNAVSNLVREGKTFQLGSIMQTNRGIGMQTQTDHMLRLVQEDLVEPAEAVRKAVDPSLMKQTLERAGFRT